MADLLVRNLDEKVVQALKRRAAEHNRSAEAEHRAILEQTLMMTRRRSLAAVLASMPDAGRDEDFERQEDKAADSVFD